MLLDTDVEDVEDVEDVQDVEILRWLGQSFFLCKNFSSQSEEAKSPRLARLARHTCQDKKN